MQVVLAAIGVPCSGVTLSLYLIMASQNIYVVVLLIANMKSLESKQSGT